ncbi:MAG: carboxypeptidase-like regulatory domain-containing protein [Gemmatimonas sp.]
MIARCVSLALLVFAAVISASRVDAQNGAAGSLVGTVFVDTTDVPLANAEVVFAKLKLSARTDREGNFQITGIPAGRHDLVVRSVGYQPFVAKMSFGPAQKVEADFMLQPAVTKLDRVDVKASADPRYATRLADFESRRRSGTGRFLTSDVFEKAVGQNMSQVLVSRIPGVRTAGKSSKQVLVSRRTGKDCAVQTIVNGMVLYNGGQPNFDINSLYTGEVLGIEYYTVANTPAQFSGTAMPRGGGEEVPGGVYCGTVVIWTK